MVVRTISAALQGIDATPVYCETVATQGIRTILIGLPDTAVKESRDRIESALREAGMRFPRRAVTINLAPADVRKEGSLYDVPIAVAVMAADGKIPTDKLEQYMMVGELSLDGAVKPVKGCLPFAILARQMHLKGIIVPRENACEAAVVNNLDVLCADTLKDVMGFMAGESEMERLEMNTREMFEKAERTYPHDFKDVKGQEMVKRAFAIAAAGGHNMIMVGPPGAGKSMMAKCLPSILPPLSLSEALETTKIHSVAGLRAATGLVTQRPFRSPHHTISSVALIGGGTNPMPGEVSLANNVLEVGAGGASPAARRPSDYHCPCQEHGDLSGFTYARCQHEPVPLWLLQPSHPSLYLQRDTGAQVFGTRVRTSSGSN